MYIYIYIFQIVGTNGRQSKRTIQWSYDLQIIGMGNTVTPHPTTWDKNNQTSLALPSPVISFKKIYIIIINQQNNHNYSISTSPRFPPQKETKTSSISFPGHFPGISPEVVLHMANIPTHSAPVPRSASRGPTGNPPPNPESHLRVASRDSEGFSAVLSVEKKQVMNRSPFFGMQHRRIQYICYKYLYIYMYNYVYIRLKTMFCKCIAFPMCTSTFWYQKETRNPILQGTNIANPKLLQKMTFIFDGRFPFKQWNGKWRLMGMRMSKSYEVWKKNMYNPCG